MIIKNYKEAISELSKIKLEEFFQIKSSDDVIEHYQLLEVSQKLNYFTVVLVYNGAVKRPKMVISTKYLVGKELIY